MRIVIDAMGGDQAPEVAVEGALDAASEWPDVDIILVGDQDRIEPLLTKRPSNLSVKHASEVIAADDEPVRAVRRKKDASMVVAGRLVKEKQAEAMISAGNTGALMTTGLLVIGRIPGIERPGLAPMIPTLNGKGVLALDLGANMDAEPEHLLQYGIMGSIYRNKVHGLEKPRIGLLNVGTEAKKGNELTKAAYELLEQASIHFVGNVESREILQAECDIIVCDGFAGNIMLKTLEGAASAIFSMLKTEFTKSLATKLAASVLKPGLKQFKNKLDYTEHGAAPLLGINGLVLKSHGSSDAKAIKNAVRQARTALQRDLVGAIVSEINGK
ncbi:phosphate acyltransferase PlsX [Paenibacillus larvae]|uniref:Phosphate acyltransferase n=5 Tax=Paenibacillus larvae TaxID=1464 RepID=V9WA49_9BACL|nr:phosphate acyltransferase PlsX [Paenibacillus larvae]AHD06002.1 phosphate acyltransferase PlsX [Paenibacillus larvae subsp. larvae DSM 25430]AQR76493.1 phosphate acyltransferase [Paenibacillus larvae subsp. larvae]AQT83676.1 phosphate acyltransferase [Paenibacillus larvae subsp. pulvifaciens]AQZ48822.1 phosphate acyltransferase [Paenibacillus larvae subsp. pulvifaciens]ARF69879.1 phosphate acyltransferase [Paenibacillus larvae subsp. pulvifaciens]